MVNVHSQGHVVTSNSRDFKMNRVTKEICIRPPLKRPIICKMATIKKKKSTCKPLMNIPKTCDGILKMNLCVMTLSMTLSNSRTMFHGCHPCNTGHEKQMKVYLVFCWSCCNKWNPGGMQGNATYRILPGNRQISHRHTDCHSTLQTSVHVHRHTFCNDIQLE